jgi:hypothetical protein
MGVARQFIPVFGGTDEWPASFPLTAQGITRSAVGETDMVDDPKRKARQGDVDRDTGERRRQEDALDEALKNTFPAPIRFQSSNRRRAGAPLVPDRAQSSGML